MLKLVEGCGVCSGTSLFIECVCERGLEKGQTVLYVPADLDPILNWCFFHDREQFWWEEKGDTPGCIYLDRDRGDCDIGLGAVVRVEDPDVG